MRISLCLTMRTYRLDRTAFKAQTAEDAANHAKYYKSLDWQERLAIAAYLTRIAFDCSDAAFKLDRTKFKIRSRKDAQ